MKRTLSIILALLIALSLFVGCGGGKSTTAGTYIVKEMGGMSIQDYFEAEVNNSALGMTLDEYLELMGLQSLDDFMVMELKEDGTATIKVAGDDPETGTWKEEGDKITITTDDSGAVELTKNGDDLVMADEDISYVFTKKK